MTTLLFLLLVLLVLRALARPAGRRAVPASSWPEAGRRLAREVLSGARELARLDAGRRDRIGRPWS
ncbi:hypothetical protein QOZ88_13510 [Blastococcus sp. BMG 814]|uniref:Uncharacterized protein n=1 Tax=Blastococcus carthaginiensis TaxID=3050034 RepID=A0ABT9IEN9_9ACTN|nr:hypothetical protein [Blastococcus carthaginiensis]MDP5183657.1 hypothetical protein [Blastococcus carthaginiensis]